MRPVGAVLRFEGSGHRGGMPPCFQEGILSRGWLGLQSLDSMKLATVWVSRSLSDLWLEAGL
jgi:hypothetical protein